MIAMLCALALKLSHLQSWVIPAAGAAFTAMALFVGYSFLGRRRQAPARPAKPREKQAPAAPPRDPFVHGSATERRLALRRTGNPREVLVSDADLTAEPYLAWVVDRSTGGLRLATGEEVAVGKVLSVRALNAPVSIPWVQAEVRSCQREEGGWEVGCQFLKTPTWSVMLLFG
jgi:hypothetical protein